MPVIIVRQIMTTVNIDTKESSNYFTVESAVAFGAVAGVCEKLISTCSMDAL